MANRAIYTESLLRVMERMRVLDPQERAYARLVSLGEEYVRTFFALAHGEVVPGIVVSIHDPVARVRAFQKDVDAWEALCWRYLYMGPEPVVRAALLDHGFTSPAEVALRPIG